MTDPESRLARLETLLSDVKEDVAELRSETLRTRGRLHSLESSTASIVTTQQANRLQEADQYRRLTLTVQVAGLLIAIAALVSPIFVVYVTGK